MVPASFQTEFRNIATFPHRSQTSTLVCILGPANGVWLNNILGISEPFWKQAEGPGEFIHQAITSISTEKPLNFWQPLIFSSFLLSLQLCFFQSVIWLESNSLDFSDWLHSLRNMQLDPSMLFHALMLQHDYWIIWQTTYLAL